MRRGYGNSEGAFAESSARAPRPTTSRPAGSAEDIGGAIAWLRQQRYVDPARVISVGVSAGGFGSLALAAAPVDGLVAVINFAGGRGSQGAADVCAPDRLVEAMGRLGAGVRVPSLWIYAVNDQYSGRSWRAGWSRPMAAAPSSSPRRRAGATATASLPPASRPGAPGRRVPARARPADLGAPGRAGAARPAAARRAHRRGARCLAAISGVAADRKGVRPGAGGGLSLAHRVQHRRGREASGPRGLRRSAQGVPHRRGERSSRRPLTRPQAGGSPRA